MKKTFICIVLILGLISCKQLKSDEDIKLTIRGHSGHFLLLVKNFKWSYGMTEINKLNGDFETLDKMVFDSLKGRNGDCLITVANASTNKYGTIDTSKTDFGFLHLDELNKFKNWEFWHKDGGIAKMIRSYYSTSPADSAKMDSAKVDTVPSNQVADTVLVTKAISNSYKTSYKFGLNDFYPNVKPKTDSTDRYIINGTIGDVQFDFGQMQVITTDGESITLQFYTADILPGVVNDMALAFQYGNTIRCVGYRVDKPEYYLMAAKVNFPH